MTYRPILEMVEGILINEFTPQEVFAIAPVRKARDQIAQGNLVIFSQVGKDDIEVAGGDDIKIVIEVKVSVDFTRQFEYLALVDLQDRVERCLTEAGIVHNCFDPEDGIDEQLAIFVRRQFYVLDTTKITGEGGTKIPGSWGARFGNEE